MPRVPLTSKPSTGPSGTRGLYVPALSPHPLDVKCTLLVRMSLPIAKLSRRTLSFFVALYHVLPHDRDLEGQRHHAKALVLLSQIAAAAVNVCDLRSRAV